jgi:hypothetical protein
MAQMVAVVEVEVAELPLGGVAVEEVASQLAYTLGAEEAKEAEPDETVGADTVTEAAEVPGAVALTMAPQDLRHGRMARQRR